MKFNAVKRLLKRKHKCDECAAMKAAQCVEQDAAKAVQAVAGFKKKVKVCAWKMCRDGDLEQWEAQVAKWEQERVNQVSHAGKGEGQEWETENQA